MFFIKICWIYHVYIHNVLLSFPHFTFFFTSVLWCDGFQLTISVMYDEEHIPLPPCCLQIHLVTPVAHGLPHAENHCCWSTATPNLHLSLLIESTSSITDQSPDKELCGLGGYTSIHLTQKSLACHCGPFILKLRCLLNSFPLSVWSSSFFYSSCFRPLSSTTLLNNRGLDYWRSRHWPADDSLLWIMGTALNWQCHTSTLSPLNSLYAIARQWWRNIFIQSFAHEF